MLLSEVVQDWTDHDLILTETKRIIRGLKWDFEKSQLIYEGRSLSNNLQGEAASLSASRVARNAAVRGELIGLQRSLGKSAAQLAILDGRDIGTVIFPDADLKIYMTASLESRARRRSEQLGVSEENCFDEIRKSIAARDAQDAGRDAAPLRVAEDAETLDTAR